MNSQELNKDFQDFVSEERDQLMSTSVEDEFKTFMDKHEDRLEKLFNTDNNFQTSTRGLKIASFSLGTSRTSLQNASVDPNTIF